MDLQDSISLKILISKKTFNNEKLKNIQRVRE